MVFKFRLHDTVLRDDKPDTRNRPAQEQPHPGRGKTKPTPGWKKRLGTTFPKPLNIII